MADEESNEIQQAENQTIEQVILSSEQQDALMQAFDDLDLDGSGTISKKELRAALQIIGQIPTEEEMEEYFSGTSEEGGFSKPEFIQFVIDHVPLKTTEQINTELINAFAAFDKDFDEFISREEFKNVMTKIGSEPLTETEADDLLDRLDTIETDGKLSIAELGKLFMGD